MSCKAWFQPNSLIPLLWLSFLSVPLPVPCLRFEQTKHALANDPMLESFECLGWGGVGGGDIIEKEYVCVCQSLCEMKLYILLLHFFELAFDCSLIKILSNLGRGKFLGGFCSCFMMSLAPCSGLALIPPHLHPFCVCVWCFLLLLLLLKLLMWDWFSFEF